MTNISWFLVELMAIIDTEPLLLIRPEEKTILINNNY